MVAVLGLTASGKSGLAEYLALTRNGELVNGDASAIYKELSVGVTKPSSADRQRVPYHLLDITDLARGMTLLEYQRLALIALEEITERGHLPIVVGGSGLYTRALLDGYLPPMIEIPPEVRQTCRDMEPALALSELKARDLAAWERVDRLNPRRVARALELTMAHGAPVPPPTAKPPEAFRILRLYLMPPRDVLLERVRRRTQSMWEGWLEEVDQLERMGLASWLEQRKPIGYGIVRAHLQGTIARGEATELIVKQTMALAKKQRTWLRKENEQENAHRWNLSQPSDWERLPREALEIVDSFLTFQANV